MASKEAELEIEYAKLEARLALARHSVATLRAVIHSEARNLTNLKAYTKYNQKELIMLLDSQGGRSTFDFEIRKQKLISHGEEFIRSLVLREVSILRDRFPRYFDDLSKKSTPEEISASLEKAIDEAMADVIELENITVERKTELEKKFAETEALRSQIADIEGRYIV